MKKIVLMMMVLIGSTALVACDNDDDNNAFDQKYVTFTRALQSRFPEAKDITWDIEGIYHVADFNVGHTEMEAWYNGDVQWVMTKTDLDSNLLSVDADVAQSFTLGDYGSWDIEEISYYERRDGDFYLFEVEHKNLPEMLLFYATDGTLLKSVPDLPGYEITPDTPSL